MRNLVRHELLTVCMICVLFILGAMHNKSIVPLLFLHVGFLLDVDRGRQSISASRRRLQ